MKKSLLLFLTMIFILVGSSNAMAQASNKQSGKTSIKPLTEAQEKALYDKSPDKKAVDELLKKKQENDAQLISKLQNQGSLIVPMLTSSSDELYIYVCQSGVQWVSRTHYYTCPFCGNSFVSVTRICL